MKMAMRKTGKLVNKSVVENLWRKLYELWLHDPIVFVELVRHSRRRSHQISRGSLRALAQLELIADGRDYPVHDAYRDLIAECVEGDGIEMMLHRPFKEDGSKVSQIVELRSGTKATAHIASKALELLQRFMERDYVTFVELVRNVRDGKEPSALYGNSLSKLLSLEMLRVEFTGSEDQRAYHQFLELMLGGILIDGPKKLVCDPILAAVLKEAAIGNSGLNIDLQSPFKPATKAHAGNGNHASNGHAKKQVVTGERSHRSAMGAQTPQN